MPNTRKWYMQEAAGPGTIELDGGGIVTIATESLMTAGTLPVNMPDWRAQAELSRCFADHRCRVWKKDLSAVLGYAPRGTLAATMKNAPDGASAVFDKEQPGKGNFVWAEFQDGTQGWVNPLAFRPIWNDMGWTNPPAEAKT